MQQQNSSTLKAARNPARSFIYGIVWLIIAVAIGSVLVNFIAADRSVFDTNGQRTGSFILLTPFIALSASILCFVRGGLAVSPYKKYLQATTPEQRRQIQKESWKKQGPPTVLIAIVTAIIYLGFLAMVIVFVINYATIGATINGTGTFVALTLMIGLLAGFFTELLVRAIRARA